MWGVRCHESPAYHSRLLSYQLCPLLCSVRNVKRSNNPLNLQRRTKTFIKQLSTRINFKTVKQIRINWLELITVIHSSWVERIGVLKYWWHQGIIIKACLALAASYQSWANLCLCLRQWLLSVWVLEEEEKEEEDNKFYHKSPRAQYSQVGVVRGGGRGEYCVTLLYHMWWKSGPVNTKTLYWSPRSNNWHHPVTSSVVSQHYDGLRMFCVRGLKTVDCFLQCELSPRGSGPPGQVVVLWAPGEPPAPPPCQDNIRLSWGWLATSFVFNYKFSSWERMESLCQLINRAQPHHRWLKVLLLPPPPVSIVFPQVNPELFYGNLVNILFIWFWGWWGWL